MRDFFLQIVMFCIGIVIGVTGPLLSERWQKLVALIFGALFVIASLFWVLYEVRTRLAKKDIPLNLSKRWQRLVTVIFTLLLVITLFWTLYGVKTLLTKKGTPPTEPLKHTATETTQNLVLFEEDFEDKKAQGFRENSPLWKVVADETGNMVYDINTPDGTYSQKTSFGSADWKNYIVEYKFRMIEFGGTLPQVSLQFRETTSVNGDTYYVQAFKTFWQEVSVESAIDGSEWISLETQQFHIEPNLWYSVRVEVNGSHFQVFIDDFLRLDVTDSLTKKGGLSLGVSKDTHHVQFDNIRVTEIE